MAWSIVTGDAATERDAPLLAIEDLAIAFEDDRGRLVPAVTGVSFSIDRGETVGVVGESGCGKSVTALAAMRLLPRSGTRIAGRITLDGRDLLRLAEPDMQALRGNRLAMIFQEPMTSLNPAFMVGDQIGEVLQRHEGLSASAARQAAIRLLASVRIPSPETRVDAYPHKLSGGMRQRVMIAMALACAPDLLIADEPTTALDVTIQAQILDLLRDLSAASGTAVLLISHDLGVVAQMCRRVIVMYAGEIVEAAPVQTVFERPQHPYTVGLLGSLPRAAHRRRRLPSIGGTVPSLARPPAGCRFAPRCPFVQDRCRREAPPLRPVGDGHASRCWRTPLEALVG